MAHAETSPAIHSSVWRILAWIGVALQAVAFLAVLWLERWNGAWTIAGFFVLSLVFLLVRERLPSLFAFLVVLAAMVNAGGWAWNWFNQFIWFDEVVHFFTTFVVVAALGWIAWSQKWTRSLPGSGDFVLQLVLLGLGLGVLWEIVEMTFLNLSWTDTVVDLVMDTLGAGVAGWFLGTIIGRRHPASAQ